MERIKTELPYIGVMSSEIGGRKENQDTCGYAETGKGLLLVVCDGMGGGPAGKTASMIATSAIIDYVNNAHENHTRNAEGSDADKKTPEKGTDTSGKECPNATLLADAVIGANAEMRHRIQQDPSLAGMGTTVAAVLIDKNCAVIAHVGDSRIYQIRDNKIVFRTADHSRVGEMVRAGALTEEQARLSAYSNIITRALGTSDTVDVEIDVRPYEKNDRFILCTDGIWGAMPQNQLVRMFVQNPRSLEGTMDVLNMEVEKAGREKGNKHDNYSAIILETKTNSILKEKMSKKVKLLLYVLGAVCAVSIILNIVQLCCGGSQAQTALEEKLKEVETKNIQANDSIDKLNSQLVDVTARLEVAEIQVESIAKIANKATEKVSTTYNEALTKIASDVRALGGMKKGKEKEEERLRIKTELNNLLKIAPDKDKAKIKEQIDLLQGPNAIAAPNERKGDKDTGSMTLCNTIANNLEKLRK